MVALPRQGDFRLAEGSFAIMAKAKGLSPEAVGFWTHFERIPANFPTNMFFLQKPVAATIQTNSNGGNTVIYPAYSTNADAWQK
jgi:hypothetical protein